MNEVGTWLEGLLHAAMVQGEAFAMSFLEPGWPLWQLLIVLGLVLLAAVLGRLLGGRLRGWLRAREVWPRWRLRAGLATIRLLPLGLFAASAWAAVGLLSRTTGASHAMIVEVAAQIATTWLAISVAARAIPNGVLRLLVAYGLAIWAAVYLLGLTREAAAVLDGAAVGEGDLRFSLLDLVTALAVTGVLLALAGLASRVMADRIRRAGDVSVSMQEFTIKAFQAVLFGVALLLGLSAVGFDLTAFAFLSGAVGLGLAFGLQKLVSNLIAGLAILLDKSIKPGDVVSVGETFGWVGTLNARYISVTTRDGREILVPNEDLLSHQVVNWSHSDDLVRLDVEFAAPRGDDPHLVCRVAVEATLGVRRVLADRPPVCHIKGFGGAGTEYVLRFWIADPSAGIVAIRGDVLMALWDAFRAHGVAMPSASGDSPPPTEAPQAPVFRHNGAGLGATTVR